MAAGGESGVGGEQAGEGEAEGRCSGEEDEMADSQHPD